MGEDLPCQSMDFMVVPDHLCFFCRYFLYCLLGGVGVSQVLLYVAGNDVIIFPFQVELALLWIVTGSSTS